MGRTTVFFVIGFFTAVAHAKPLTPEQVPEPLNPWVDWVLQDQPELGCPFIYNSYGQKRCNWPSQSGLDFTATKGRFAINWSVYKESCVFRLKAATHSILKLPLVPVNVATPWW
jgi:hypothetical protein